MQPTRVAAAAARLGRWPGRIVTIEPNVDVVKVDLFAPEHAGERLPLNAAFVCVSLRGMYGCVKLIGLRTSLREDLFYLSQRLLEDLVR